MYAINDLVQIKSQYATAKFSGVYRIAALPGALAGRLQPHRRRHRRRRNGRRRAHGPRHADEGRAAPPGTRARSEPPVSRRLRAAAAPRRSLTAAHAAKRFTRRKPSS